MQEVMSCVISYSHASVGRKAIQAANKAKMSAFSSPTQHRFEEILSE